MKCVYSRMHAVTIKRRHLLRRVAAASIVWALAGVAPAAADVTVGQLAPTAPSPSAGCSGTNDFLQPSVTGGNLYTAKEAGEISSWSTNSSIGGASYTFKVFRRTSDPDVFQVISHAVSQTLPTGSGVRNFPIGIHVESGDLIGFNVSGGAASCTFPQTGDSVLASGGSLSDGDSGPFSPQDDVRLNLAANLVPTNTLTFGGVARNKKFGTAVLTVRLSNPGSAVMTGKGIKKRHKSKSAAVAGPITFAIAPAGPTLRRLNRGGSALVHVTVTFTPPGGDPHSESLAVKLKKRKSSQTLP
jgi:hypothetical protein